MELTLAIVVVIYKIAALFTGLAFGFMGYKLFLLEKSKSAGSVELEYKGWRVFLKRFRPETFFTMFGAAIVIYVLYVGLEVDFQSQGVSSPKHNYLPPKLPSTPSK